MYNFALKTTNLLFTRLPKQITQTDQMTNSKKPSATNIFILVHHDLFILHPRDSQWIVLATGFDVVKPPKKYCGMG
jgi:hypothetical protein